MASNNNDSAPPPVNMNAEETESEIFASPKSAVSTITNPLQSMAQLSLFSKPKPSFGAPGGESSLFNRPPSAQSSMAAPSGAMTIKRKEWAKVCWRF